ncbi:MAG: hypothetical protein LBS92_00665 [Candidatus Methanoplasma sp.]|nr:hypothetical protein [Candidatus Methanoplasma sp.]
MPKTASEGVNECGLTRHACRIVVQNGDHRKEAIALRQGAEAQMPAREYESKPLKAMSKPGLGGFHWRGMRKNLDAAVSRIREVADTVTAMAKRKTGRRPTAGTLRPRRRS